MKLLITYIQQNDNGERYRLYDDSIAIEDTFFDPDNLYRSLQKEFGRCTGKVYVDYLHSDSKFGPYHVGWVFQKRKRFRDEYGWSPSDGDGSYLAETWVSVADKDETVRVREYRNLGR